MGILNWLDSNSGVELNGMAWWISMEYGMVNWIILSGGYKDHHLTKEHLLIQTTLVSTISIQYLAITLYTLKIKCLLHTSDT